MLLSTEISFSILNIAKLVVERVLAQRRMYVCINSIRSGKASITRN